MITKVWEFAKEYGMLQPDDKIVAGVSGGADSVCLLFMLEALKQKLPFELLAVHVEHGIRGAEALEDRAFVERLCEKKGILCRSYSYDVPNIARSKGISLEEAGRFVRYEAFGKALEEWGGTKIAVAHNQNDQSETVLLNLFRGSGLKGLGGIRPVRGNIIRPVLCLTRAEIERYLNENEISYRTDSTNLTEEYTRNKIRLKVLPYAEKEINKKAGLHVAESAKHMAEAYDYLERAANKCLERCASFCKQGCSLNAEVFRIEETIIKKYALRICMQSVAGMERDITSSHIEAVMGLVEAEVGRKISLPYQMTARKTYTELIIQKEELVKRENNRKSFEIPQLPFKGRIECFDVEADISIMKEISKKNVKIPEKIYTKWLDYDRIKGNLQLRTREAGDYICINSELKKQKLKSYFINEKVPCEQRDSVLLLADGHHIVWIIGYRISEAYKITERTKNIIKVQINREMRG